MRPFLDHLETGLTREHALFFLFGIGANGKFVFRAQARAYDALNRKKAHNPSQPSRRGVSMIGAVLDLAREIEAQRKLGREEEAQ